jgi:hypothetical protein
VAENGPNQSLCLQQGLSKTNACPGARARKTGRPCKLAILALLRELIDDIHAGLVSGLRKGEVQHENCNSCWFGRAFGDGFRSRGGRNRLRPWCWVGVHPRRSHRASPCSGLSVDWRPKGLSLGQTPLINFDKANRLQIVGTRAWGDGHVRAVRARWNGRHYRRWQIEPKNFRLL